MKDDAALELPDFHTFKVFGRRSEEFSEQVRATIAATVGPIPLDSMKIRASAQGRYVCVSITTFVHSREQLERVYADLRSQTDMLLFL
ncbi:MAG: DUF493 domain-containing protein [Deltaproteobacteria bacterium]|nr:DUF493 domain-containing protein [Deltaproteobacteria bacterium]MBI3389003.1 DUF493 domain-containing protein [Deltaproteobacteria bacterium]